MNALSETGNVIRTVPRDIRVVKGREILASRALPTRRFVSFAEGILRRYRGRAMWLLNNDPVLLHLRAGTAKYSTIFNPLMHLAPSITLAVPKSPLLLQHARFIERELLVQTIVTQGKRLEAGVEPAGAPATASPMKAREHRQPFLPPMPKVHRRTNVTTANGTELPAESASAKTRVRQPLEAAPIDVNRLADQVIQTIDRRIIAHRERMGRI